MKVLEHVNNFVQKAGNKECVSWLDIIWRYPEAMFSQTVYRPFSLESLRGLLKIQNPGFCHFLTKLEFDRRSGVRKVRGVGNVMGRCLGICIF